MRSKHTRWVLALAVAAAACSASPEPPVPESPVPESPVPESPEVATSATTTTAPMTVPEAVAGFHSCLADFGFSVPNIPLDDAGRPDLSGLGNQVDQSSPEWREALASCAAVIVTHGALDLAGVPDLAEAVRAELQAFSACMRSQGVEGFPDPAADFDGIKPPFPLDSIPSDDPELGTAAENCALTVGELPPGAAPRA